jgi:3-hydroxymyristoyl/3-hydroxydecanoyl-(acyl carrier protein) dehydratase
LSLPCPVTDLIPQKGKMGFDQILKAIDGDAGRSAAMIKAGHLFLDNRGQLSNIALIEYVNQLIAAAQGYKELVNAAPMKKGLFVGLQEARFLQPVRLGETLTFHKTLAEEVAPVNFVQGIVERDGERIATFVTKIYEIKDLAELDLAPPDVLPEPKRAVAFNTAQPPACLGSNLRRQLYAYLCELNRDAGEIIFKLACPPDFAGFDGHFPERPILPGIILLEIAQLALELLLKQPVVLKTIKKMKISGVVLPNQVISGTVKVNLSDCGADPSFIAVFKAEPGREVSRFNGSCEGRQY